MPMPFQLALLAESIREAPDHLRLRVQNALRKVSLLQGRTGTFDADWASERGFGGGQVCIIQYQHVVQPCFAGARASRTPDPATPYLRIL